MAAEKKNRYKGTRVMACRGARCFSKGQDAMYGKMNRVFNHAPGKGLIQYPNRWRCSVCGDVTETRGED
jgi:hypothetical protein